MICKLIENSIMAYKSNTGDMPNTVMMPWWVYEELKKDSEKVKLKFCSEIEGNGKVFGFDIMVVEHIKGVVPLKVIKK